MSERVQDIFQSFPIPSLTTAWQRLRGQLIRLARNSPSSFQVLPSGDSDSPSQWNESDAISVKVQRVGVPSGRTPNLDDILAAPTANLFFVVIPGRIPPRYAPSLNRGVPHAEGCAVHIHLLVIGARSDPNDGA